MNQQVGIIIYEIHRQSHVEVQGYELTAMLSTPTTTPSNKIVRWPFLLQSIVS